MGTLYISEYADIAATYSKNAQMAAEPAQAQQHIVITSTANATAAFNGNTRVIRVHTDSICCIKIGAAPVAVATDQRMAANTTEYYGVKGAFVLSCITAT